MSKLKTWMDAATPAEKSQLATLAGTTVATLRHAAGEYRAGSMKAGPAGKIALASRRLHRKNPDLPLLTRADLCVDCAQCEFYKKSKRKI